MAVLPATALTMAAGGNPKVKDDSFTVTLQEIQERRVHALAVMDYLSLDVEGTARYVPIQCFLPSCTVASISLFSIGS
jgi:hypothetical protein